MIAQKCCFVHKNTLFVHFIWVLGKKSVPLQRF